MEKLSIRSRRYEYGEATIRSRRYEYGEASIRSRRYEYGEAAEHLYNNAEEQSHVSYEAREAQA